MERFNQKNYLTFLPQSLKIIIVPAEEDDDEICLKLIKFIMKIPNLSERTKVVKISGNESFDQVESLPCIILNEESLISNAKDSFIFISYIASKITKTFPDHPNFEEIDKVEKKIQAFLNPYLKKDEPEVYSPIKNNKSNKNNDADVNDSPYHFKKYSFKKRVNLDENQSITRKLEQMKNEPSGKVYQPMNISNVTFENDGVTARDVFNQTHNNTAPKIYEFSERQNNIDPSSFVFQSKYQRKPQTRKISNEEMKNVLNKKID